MSDNKFIKIAQPAPTPSTPVPAAPSSPSDLARQREEAAQERRERRRIEREEAEAGQKGYNKEPARQLISKLVEKASKQGLNAEELAKELESRAVLIRRLLGWISEDQLAKYFDEFLFKKEIPWTKALELMNLALEGASSGISIPDSLDFALAHYAEKRNFTLTKDILNSSKTVQPLMRSLNVMKLLKDAMTGNVPDSFSFMALGPKNAENFVILNELMQLAVARPEEDLEQTRIQFQKSLDAYTRAREVDDRYKAIFQMLLSDEFNRVMKRNVEFVTRMFKDIATKPEFLAMRRILVALKMGEAMRDQILSDIEQKRTAPGTQKDLGSDLTRRSSKNQNIRLSQNVKSQVIDPQKQKILQTSVIKPMLSVYTKFLDLLTKKQQQEAQSNIKSNIDYNTLLKDLRSFIGSLESIDKQIDNNSLTLQFFNDNYWGAAKLYISKYQNYRDKKLTAFNSNRYVKLAQISMGSFQNLLRPDTLLEGVITAAGGAMTVSGLLNLDPRKALGGLVFTTLYSNFDNQIRELSNLGLNAPVQVASTFASELAAENISKLFRNANDSLQFQKLDQSLKSFDELIQNKKQAVMNLTESNLATGVGQGQSVSSYVRNPQVVQKAYVEFRQDLEKAMNVAKFLRDFIQQRVQLPAKTEPDFLQYEASFKNYLAYIQSKVTEYEKTYQEFASISYIAEQMQKVRVLKNELKTLIPELEKYLKAGASITDLIRIPGGLGQKIKSIIDEEVEARDILFRTIQEMEEYIKQKQQTGGTQTTPPPPSVSAPSAPSVPTSPGPSSASLQTKNLTKSLTKPLEEKAKSWAAKQLGPEFANLFNLKGASEENSLLKIANNPEELSKSYTDNFVFSSAIREAQTQIDMNSARIKHYTQKINDPKTRKDKLREYIQKDTNLTEIERNYLIDSLNRSIVGTFQTGAQAYLQTGSNLGNLPQEAESVSSLPLTPERQEETTTPQTPSTPQIPSTPSANVPSAERPSLTVTDPEDVTRQRLNALFDSLNESTALNIQVSPESVESQPELLLNSLTQQWREVSKRVNQLQGFQYQLLTSPVTDLGSLSSLANNNLKFVKLASENDKEKIADQVIEDYYNELYDESTDSPEFGTALEHPQKWRKVPTTKIPERKHN